MSDMRYKLDNPGFETVLRLLNYDILNEYDENELKEIRKICEQILSTSSNVSLGKTLEMTKEDIKIFFLEMIKSFNNKDVLEYYKKRLEDMDIYFRKYIKKEGAQINLGIKDEKIICGPILLPARKHIREYDLLSFSHEMGHVACYENKKKSIEEYFEFSEVIPILFEYFSSLKLQRRNPYNYFSINRLSCERKAAELVLDALSYLENASEKAKNNCVMPTLIEGSKYLYSSDIAFQIIDFLKTDKDEVIKGIGEIIIGDKSVKDMTEHLGIKSNCKRLIKEYERRIT